MKHSYSRPLNDDEAVEHFLYKQLNYKKDKNIIPLVVKGEIALPSYEDFPTSTSKKYRNSEYRDEEKRWGIRAQIVKELFELHRHDDDNAITLGNGGAAPTNKIEKDRQAIILIGLPASGKSFVANKIADNYGAYVLDSDFAKRKLPEFTNYEWGASLVHDESDQIVFGFEDKPEDFKSLFEKVTADKCNLVIPKIGQKSNSVILLAETLRNMGYRIHLVLVHLKREMATLRAVERYRETKRYVPLGLIFDGYGNDPILTYYILKCQQKNLFSSFGEISTDSQPAKVTDIENDSPVKLFV